MDNQDKKCYRDRLYTARVTRNDALFEVIMDEALNDISESLTNMVNSYHAKDLPFLVGAIKMVCRNLEATMSKSDLALVESSERDVTSVAIFGPREGGKK